MGLGDGLPGLGGPHHLAELITESLEEDLEVAVTGLVLARILEFPPKLTAVYYVPVERACHQAWIMDKERWCAFVGPGSPVAR